ncbi:MAG: histidinol dehydrogenase, partial [Chloroflexi bacterium]|nr:histidinol dehydrogenase [Chloroflexota bacterium]
MIRIFDLSEARETILRRKIFGTEIRAALRASLRRVFDADLSPEDAVRKILDDVRAHGDDAVRAWTQKIDGVALDSFDAPRAEWRAAYERLDADLQNSLRVAAERIRAFHARQPLPQWTTNDLGGTVGQKISPLDRVGVYVPGGATPLPSSLLMAAIPARVAGVKEIIVATPPRKSDGASPDVILAAAHLAEVDAVYRVGGAQAIAAMAFGTKNIPRVDKIVGPGGLFVTLAKKQLYGQVGLDGLAGPTETMIVADYSANPVWIAADLLAQAEHDILATAILVTPSRALAIKVQSQIAAQIETRARAEIIAAALEGQSGIVIAPHIDAALQIAEEFAPEHLCLSLRDAEQYASRVRH